MPKIEISHLKSIIQEELKLLREGTDHDSASKQMSSATKLLGAIEAFKEAASEKAKSELGTSIEEVHKILSRIVSSPMQYVDTVNPPVKKVTLKAQKSSDTL